MKMHMACCLPDQVNEDNLISMIPIIKRTVYEQFVDFRVLHDETYDKWMFNCLLLNLFDSVIKLSITDPILTNENGDRKDVLLWVVDTADVLKEAGCLLDMIDGFIIDTIYKDPAEWERVLNLLVKAIMSKSKIIKEERDETAKKLSLPTFDNPIIGSDGSLPE